MASLRDLSHAATTSPQRHDHPISRSSSPRNTTSRVAERGQAEKNSESSGGEDHEEEEEEEVMEPPAKGTSVHVTSTPTDPQQLHNAMSRTTSAPVMLDTRGDSSAARVAPLPRKLSVAALIRSFSPRSRTNKATNQESGGSTENGHKPKIQSTLSVPTFGKLKRSSLSFRASPPRERGGGGGGGGEEGGGRGEGDDQPPAKVASPSSVSKWKQTIQAVARDTERLRIQIPPPHDPSPHSATPLPPAQPLAPPPTAPPSSTVCAGTSTVDPAFTSGPGSFVDDVRVTLAKLLTALDAIDPRKLHAIRLGGELRGLLGKAQDEFQAYEDAFHDHVAKVGVAIALQNFAASLHQVFPIVERLQTTKFLLNRQFKRDVTFAFQEINSYYTSMFMELSMAVAQSAGLVLPLPTPAKLGGEEAKEEEGEEEEEIKPREPTGEELCLEAHQHFFGHGCQVDLPRALALYKQAAAKESAIAKRCLGHMLMVGSGAERDLFAAEKWLAEAVSAGDTEALYLLGCLLCDEKAPNQKTPTLTRAFFKQAQAQFTMAAERGHVEAQYRLARLLESGDAAEELEKGIGDHCEERSDRIRRAMPWYRRAAEHRHTKSEAALGRILLLHYEEADPRRGRGGSTMVEVEEEEEQIRNNATEAIHWLQRAASSGENADALTLLGVVLTTGHRGAKRDVDRGIAFLRRAVAAGSHEAMLRLARLLLSEATPASSSHQTATTATTTAVPLQDREEHHDEALRLFLTVAQCCGDSILSADANYEVAELLCHSWMLRDHTAALRFFTKAAQTRPPHAVAARRAATMLYSGTGCRVVDKPQAHRLYSIAADAGDAEALNALGLMHEDGDGCDLDFQKALRCYQRAVALGSRTNRSSSSSNSSSSSTTSRSTAPHAHAHFNLGCLLAQGKGVARNLDAAQAHFQKALALGYTLARDFLRPESCCNA